MDTVSHDLHRRADGDSGLPHLSHSTIGTWGVGKGLVSAGIGNLLESLLHLRRKRHVFSDVVSRL